MPPETVLVGTDTRAGSPDTPGSRGLPARRRSPTAFGVPPLRSWPPRAGVRPRAGVGGLLLVEPIGQPVFRRQDQQYHDQQPRQQLDRLAPLPLHRLAEADAVADGD